MLLVVIIDQYDILYFDMYTKIHPWMFRMPKEYASLLVSISLLLLCAYIFSLINLYLVLGLLIAGIIYVKLAQSQYIGNAVRVHGGQFTELYDVFISHAKKLGISRASLYIRQDPNLNAFTIGITRCTVVLTSSLVEQFSNDELSFVIGHELGHFAAGHTTLSTLINPLGTGNIFANFIFGFWQRKTELTADRCGLILTNDIDNAISSVIKLSIGGKLYTKMDKESYLQQLSNTQSISVKLSELLLDHPLHTNRIKSLYVFWKQNFKNKNEMS